ncbi:hypothetical protein MKZ38_000359 [Zalerion maritima]|uniref:Rab-GAP TBC domain-containing protein n=1 Tax=Zalerion maritima TaxID=339359 RepID=A0AAD5WUP2_9PEZI|nr:hypothetical protein MKZ38_000359 [Zalerion maritima]
MASQQQQQNGPMSAISSSVPAKHLSNPLDDKSAPDPTMVMQHDSMVTVRLSEPSPSTKTSFGPDSIPLPGKSLLSNDLNQVREYVPQDVMAESVREEDESEGVDEEDATTVGGEDTHQRNLQDELEETGMRDEEDNDLLRREQEIQRELLLEQEEVYHEEVYLEEVYLEEEVYHEGEVRQEEEANQSDSDEVNWDQLQKTEDEQSQDPEADNSTAMLLARLEQENNKLATNPKTANMHPPPQQSTRKPRPPSMAQLRQMVTGPTPQALRYSMLPPPPMTDLEFYAALVKDYEQTVARLPTLVANKIRKGIPPPLRGVVWQSMSRARDVALEDMYDRLSGESSPFETSIGKDLGRTFPGVEMFRDPEGDGQRMLGRVLKCFSLYDPKIGYCQGLAFIVGPLLMHMPDKQAFCVLVRLMETYDIRNCFLQEMPGLHVRIYQFSELLRQNLPTLSNHLEDLRVEPIYVSQWFLSFFAVTCPLPMLFRIYDVVFAEGVSETLMRVALSLMRKNQARILACNEFEDVMQLLLSRGLWDCYHYNADEFVDDFVEYSNVVTGETLRALEQTYQQQRETSQSTTANAAQLPSDVTTAASRFLGRLWASTSGASPKPTARAPTTTTSTATPISNPITSSSSSTTPTPPANNHNNTLSPGLTAPPRPLSMLKRSASKQSLASTLNSMEAGSASVVSTASTDATSVSRDSSNTDDSSTIDAPTRSTAKATTSATAATAPLSGNNTSTTNSETKYLNSQIEDLLTALSELQQTHALLASELQQEREEREEDKKVVSSLLDELRATTSKLDKASEDAIVAGLPTEKRAQAVGAVEQRFGFEGEVQMDRRSSSGPSQTKSQLRQDLERTKERLTTEESRGEESKRRILDLQTDITTLKDQLRESRDHARVLHADKQRLEKQIHTMRVRASASTNAPDVPTVPDTTVANRQSTAPGASGLREFKLGRSKSTPSQVVQFNKRTSSMPRGGGDTSNITVAPVSAPANEHEALLMELVQAKTAEAIAKQEAEEARAKLDQLRKQFGLSFHGDGSAAAPSTAQNAASAALGVFGRLTGATPAAEAPKPAPAPVAPKSAPATNSGGGGGFWGWRR